MKHLSSLSFYAIFVISLLVAHPVAAQKTNMTGTITQAPFVNKKGDTIPNQSDWYLKKEDKKYYIKVCASRVKEKQLQNYEGLVVKARVVKTKGRWDDNCQNKGKPVQSREGPFLKVQSLQLKGK